MIDKFRQIPKSKKQRSSGRSGAKNSFQRENTVSRDELLVGDSDNTFRNLLYDLSYVATLIEAVRRQHASAIGLTPPQHKIVMVVADHESADGINVRDIAETLRVSGAFVTAEAKKLEANGFLFRVPNPVDGRSVLLKLGPIGEAQLRRITDTIRLYNDKFFGLVTREDFELVPGALNRLITGGEDALLNLFSRDGNIKPLMKHASGRARRLRLREMRAQLIASD